MGKMIITNGFGNGHKDQKSYNLNNHHHMNNINNTRNNINNNNNHNNLKKPFKMEVVDF